MTRVLVLEHNKALRAVLCAALSDCGYAAVGLATGEQAIREAKRQPFDVLIFDLVLPGISGLAVFAALQAEHQKLIGIGMSGIRTDPTTARSVEQQGAIAFLVKPFDVACLQTLIETFAEASCPGLVESATGLSHALADSIGHRSSRQELLQKLVNAACARDLCGLCFFEVADLIRSIAVDAVSATSRLKESSRQSRCIKTAALDTRARQAIHTLQQRGPTCRQTAMAQEIGVSVSHLGRLVRQSGISYLDWVRAPRLKAPLKDIVWSNKQMKAVAVESGFSSTSSLDRVFKRYFGVSPSMLRRQSRDEA